MLDSVCTECSLPVSHLCAELVSHEKCNPPQLKIVVEALPVHHHQCGQINGRIEGRLSLIALKVFRTVRKQYTVTEV